MLLPSAPGKRHQNGVGEKSWFLHFHNFSYTLLIYVNLLHLVTLLNCATPQKLPSVAVACSVGA